MASTTHSIGRPLLTVGLTVMALLLHGSVIAGNRSSSLTTTHTVQNCNTSGAGSLREAAGLAVDGDLIDLSHLTCNIIFVRQAEGGELAVRDITIRGPGKNKLTISGNGENRIFNHTGSPLSTLTIVGLTVENGDVSGKPSGQNYGGCILSNPNVSVKYSTIRSCKAAVGGGISAGRASLDHTLMTLNLATGTGGAIYAGYSEVAYSTISNNSAGNGGGIGGGGTVMNSTVADNLASYNGAGLWGTTGDVYILSRSTVSGNVANGRGGGIYLVNDLTWPGSTPSSFAMDDSTLSGNRSVTGEGGAYVVASASAFIDNSTIAYNTSNKAGGGAAGVRIASVDAHINNSIVASNSSDDGKGVDLEFESLHLSVLGGSHNLILTGQYTNMPNAVHGCPGLYALGNYGGTTKTHALAATSPAIDKGGPTDEVNDQRGARFVRVVGAAADVGSYERQSAGGGRSMIPELQSPGIAPMTCLAASR